jgi:hypothetical protein
MMQLNKGKFGDKQIVSEANLKENHTPHIIVSPAEITFSELGYATYGMGWSINTYRGFLRLSHNGSIEGYRSQMAFFPNENLGVAVLTNTGLADYYFVNSVTNYVADRWLNLSIIDWPTRLKTAQAQAKAKTEKAKQENAAIDESQTRSPRTIWTAIQWHLSNTLLTVLSPWKLRGEEDFIGVFHGLPFTLKHYHYDVFRRYQRAFDQAKFDFRIDAKGAIDRVMVSLSNAGEIEFKKVATSP